MNNFPSDLMPCHADLLQEAKAQLAPAETIVAWFAPDLNPELHFARSLVVLTNQRLLSSHAIRAGATPTADASSSPSWQAWPLDHLTTMRYHSRAGVGTLELIGQEGQLASWCYTPAQASAARNLADRFNLPRGAEGVALIDANEEDGAAETPAAPPRVRSLFRLFRFAKPHLRVIVLGVFLAFASTAAGLIPPYLTMPLLDDVLIPYQSETKVARAALEAAEERGEEMDVPPAPERPRMLVIWYLVGLGGAACASWLLAWGQGVVMARVSERISADLRQQTYSQLMQLSVEFFGARRTGDLISRVSSDTDRICTFLSDNLVDFGTDLLMIAGTTAVLVWIDPTLAMATVLPFPLIGWLAYRVRRKLSAGFTRGGRAWAAMTSVLADTIPGIRVVKAFAQEGHEIERFRRANEAVVEVNSKVNTVWASFWPMLVFLNQLGLLVVWAVGAWRMFELEITVGVLTMFITYISRFYARLESMSRMLSITQRAAASAERIFLILDQVSTVPEPVHPVHPGRIRGEIEIRNLGFRYGNRTVLENFNLHVQPGEMIGLVGPSGAGKSTLVNLICRFYDPCDGVVLVDGHDIRSFTVREYRHNLGVVLQDPFLFYGTIAENIAYGRPDATREEIINAARAAFAHQFILRLPDGYDSIVGERGQSLSGGERQRIAIARALLIDPRILILDEATSSVDTETELEIQAALDNLIRGRTTIAVAHRLNTLRRADRLIVLEHGRIAEMGRHDELLETPGVYSRLHRANLELAGSAAH